MLEYHDYGDGFAEYKYTEAGISVHYFTNKEYTTSFSDYDLVGGDNTYCVRRIDPAIQVTYYMPENYIGA